MDILQLAAIPVVIVAAVIQPNAVAHHKGIVAMNAIVKLFNPVILAGAAQDIRVHCHA